jgi:peptide/nickel transport system permease protein
VTRYVLLRLPSAILVLVLASVLVFFTLRLVPGDPARTLAGADAGAAAVAEIRSSLGLDQSIVSQYLDWIGGMLRLDPGRSYAVGGEIVDLIGAAVGNTLALALAALLLAVTIALVASVGSVLAERRWLDHLLAVANTRTIALPAFVTGPLLVIVFAVALERLPAGGTPPDGFIGDPGAALRHLLLPAICLALPVSAALTRFLTESLRTQMEQPYVTTARALGIRRRRVVLTQALPNALPPVVTILGVQVGALLGGAVLVESIFTWPGLGLLIEQAIAARDYPLVQTLLLLSVFVFVVTQLLTDVVNAWLDPRIRLGGAR